MLNHLNTAKTILNTAAWVLLVVSLTFNWALITQRIDVLGHDSFTRAISEIKDK